MWKKTLDVGGAARLTDLRKEINRIAMEALTTHIQIEHFAGTKADEEFAYIQRKLINHLEFLENSKLLIQDRTDLIAICETESNIRRSLADLEAKASENQKQSLRTLNIKGHLARTHSASKLPSDHEKSELLKAESIVQQVKKQVNNLETNLETHTSSENLNAVNNLEEKIVHIYTDLENIQGVDSNELKKLKDELYRDLYRCSGKLKKARRKSSATVPDAAIRETDNHQEQKNDSKTFKEVQDIRSIDAQLKSVEEANRGSFEDLNARINSLTRQISQSLNGEKNGSQVAIKIKAEALKLAWESLKQHLYSENVRVDVMVEIIDDLDQLAKDLHVNSKQLKKYLRRKDQSDLQNGENCCAEKQRLKDVVKQLKTLKTKIACFQGWYKDEDYNELQRGIEECSEMLKGVESGADIKLDLAKPKIQHKIIEYLEMLDEKAVKP